MNSVSTVFLLHLHFREIFINPATNDVWQSGDRYTRKNLAVTLGKIAENGDDEFYTGATAQKLVADLQAGGGIITMEDLKNYT